MSNPRIASVLAVALALLGGCGGEPASRSETVPAPATMPAVPAALLNAPGDAGPSAGGAVPSVPAAVPQPGGLVFAGRIHVLGGGVRGYGLLARFPAGGPRRITVTRATAPPAHEAYRPDCLLRVEDPAGRALAVRDLADAGSAPIEVAVPEGPAGTWTVSVIGGRQQDAIAVALPASACWGVRGEMSLAVTAQVPERAWLWVPPEARTLLVEQFGGEPGAVAVLAEDGRELSRTATGAKTGKRLVAVLDSAPAGAVVALDLSRARGLAVMVDGVPGLLCPDPAMARELRGGTVESAGFRCAGPLQARVRAWMAKQRPEDLAVPIALPAAAPEDLADPMAEAQLFGQYGGLSGLRPRLARQILDPASPWCGTDYAAKAGDPARVRWDTGVNAGLLSPFLANSLAAVVATPARLNPLHGSPALARRAALAAFYHLSAMTGDRLVREGNSFASGDSYPITHCFFVFGSLGAGLAQVQDWLDPEARELWREGVLALSDKLADHQGYQSNQWSHNLLGHLGAWRATGEPRLRERFERQVRAYLAGAYGSDAKYGQHPAGFYLEEFGCDGNYDNMNLTSVVAMLHEYGSMPGADPALVAELRASAERNLRFKSLLWMTDLHGAPTCPSAFNSRRPESSLALSNPSGDHLASRDSALASAKARLTAMPATGTFPANVFPYYVASDAWARRLIADGLAKGLDDANAAGSALLPLWFEAFRRPLPAPAELPVQAASGLWELPGIVAWKRGGTYGVVFHDVAGANPAKKINQAVMGGGPTALWRAGCGMAVATMSSTHKPNLATTPDEATFSCVFATDAQGRFVHSGTERTRLTWLEPGRSFAISARLLPAPGDLTWRYDLGEDGSVAMTVTLAAPGLSGAMVNLPLTAPANEADFAIESGVVVRRTGPGTVRLAATDAAGGPLALALTGPLACAGNATVRCARVAVPADGTPVTIRFAGE